MESAPFKPIVYISKLRGFFRSLAKNHSFVYGVDEFLPYPSPWHDPLLGVRRNECISNALSESSCWLFPFSCMGLPAVDSLAHRRAVNIQPQCAPGNGALHVATAVNSIPLHSARRMVSKDNPQRHAKLTDNSIRSWIFWR